MVDHTLIPPPPPPPASPHTVPLQLHALQAFIFFAGIGWTGLDPFTTAVASAVVAWIHCLVFLRCNPRIAGIELIVLILTAYYWPSLSLYIVLWVAAAALAGGAAALLSVRKSREDDFYFLPPAAALLAYAVLVWLAEGCRFAEPIAAAQKWLGVELGLLALGFDQQQVWTQLQALYSPEALANLPAAFMIFLAALWTMSLWLAGRSARRWAGISDPRRTSLILFRIEPHYLFLLICPLVFWILGILAGREKLALMAAGPFLAVFGAACAVEGAAVILFRLALLRLTMQPVHWLFMTVGLVVPAALFPALSVPALALLGLVDIWFDFRRVKAVEERFGISG